MPALRVLVVAVVATATLAVGAGPVASQDAPSPTTEPSRTAAGTLTASPVPARATRGVPFSGSVGTFTDSTPGAVRDSGAFVRAAYLDVLGRAVDPPNEVGWVRAMDQRTPRSRLAAVLVGSEEGRRAVVVRLYQAALRRVPRVADRAYWAGILGRGLPVDAVRAQLYGSDEFFAGAGGNNAAFLDALYRRALGRPPDRPGRTYFAGLLARGASRVTVSGSLLGNAEARRRVVADHHVRLLARAPTTAESTFWVARLAVGVHESSLTLFLLPTLDYLRKLPEDYTATVVWGSGPARSARLRKVGANLFAVVGAQRFTSDGRITVHIEVARSGGGQLSFDSTLDVVGPRNERFVRQLYREVLGRSVDGGALAARTRDLRVGGARARGRVVSVLTSSEEYRRRRVTSIYDAYLARAPSASESDRWFAILRFGAPVDAVRSGVLGSREYYRRAGGSVVGFLDAVYREVLGRAPDRGGRAYNAGLLASGRTRESVARGLLSSAEADGRFVVDRYGALLRRTPGASERNFWVSALGRGLTEPGLVSALTTSTEYFDRFPPGTSP
ncbi:MAG: DUF4214 domain-containing protein [Actinomycetota bacterium]|nr:DUF4214 domain-containing protein [Actinomycetota bacterium]